MNRSTVLAVVFAVLMVASPAASVVGAASPAALGSTATAEQLEPASPPKVSSASVAEESAANAQTDRSTEDTSRAAPIQPALREAEGTTQVVVRLASIDKGNLNGLSRAQTAQALKQHAKRTQTSVTTFAKDTEGVSVLNTFWVTNAVLLEVDKSKVDLQKIAQLDHVQRLFSNFEVKRLDQPSSSSAASASSDSVAAADNGSYNTTPELGLVNASKAWSKYNTMGEGIDVALLDTGVDDEHPDINGSFQNFVQVASDGSLNPGVEAHDSGSHGTHTAGTVVGDNNSGRYIGVAPKADLMMGQVLWDGGSTYSSIIGGMQWAMNNDAEIIGMSLGCTGAPCYEPAFINPVQNAQAADIEVVVAIGNCQVGCSSSPGNVYPVVSAGAVNDDGSQVAQFSGGEVVDTSEDWGSAAPPDWPATYVEPDFTAPGVNVCSSVPGSPGGYACDFSGTSMASPHISGVVALMQSAAGDLPPSRVKRALNATAWIPGGDPPGANTRYGQGIVDADDAVGMVARDQGVNGTVTGADTGMPVDATVTAAGLMVHTGPDGTYSIPTTAGNVSVNADAFGYAPMTKTVTVPNGSFVTQNFSLNPTVEVSLMDGQQDAIMGGNSVSAKFEAMQATSVRVDLMGSYNESNATLYVNGQMASFGENVSINATTVNVTVETASGTSGDISLQHTFMGPGGPVTKTTGPTNVYEELIDVAVVHTDQTVSTGVGQKGIFADETAQMLRAELSGKYRIHEVEAQNVMSQIGKHDVFVVHNMPDDQALINNFVSATQPLTKGVVWLEQDGIDAEALVERSAATGNPASVTEDGTGSSNTHYVNVMDGHPIFDGVNTSGGIPVLNQGELAVFSGTDGVVLAEATNGDEQGTAITYNSNRNRVFLGSIAPTSGTPAGDYTDAAHTILANSVRYTHEKIPTIVGETRVTNDTAQPGGTATVTIETTAPDVAGYELNLSFDPSKVKVMSVTGVDMADPVTNVNNEQGWVTMAQTASSGTDQPKLIRITFDVTMQNRDDWANLQFVAPNKLVDENGSRVYTTWQDGTVKVANLEGDVNGDSEITIADATLVQRYIVGKPINGPFDMDAADVNDDGQITSADVTAILNIVVGNSDPGDYGSSSNGTTQLRASPGRTAAGVV